MAYQPSVPAHRPKKDGGPGTLSLAGLGRAQPYPPQTLTNPSNRASVPASAWPFTASGRQCR